MYNPIVVIDGHIINLTYVTHADKIYGHAVRNDRNVEVVISIIIKYINGDISELEGIANAELFLSECKMRGYAI